MFIQEKYTTRSDAIEVQVLHARLVEVQKLPSSLNGKNCIAKVDDSIAENMQ